MYMYLWIYMHVYACRDLELTSVSSWVTFHFAYWGKIFHFCLFGLDFMYALGILTPYSYGANALFVGLSPQLSMFITYITYIVRIFENLKAQALQIILKKAQ